MNTDPISDLLTRIRNSINAHKYVVNAPYSKIKENIVRIMKERKFIDDYKVDEENNFKILKIELNEDRSDLTLKRVSKPGQRIYVKSTELKTIKSGLGIRIISTPKGLMTNLDARKQNLGGEILCEIY
jgi:small subunit ribosomal protein S8